MSWASKRRTTYAAGIILFFGIIIGIPLILWLYEPATCFDGKKNQQETAVDKGGPCILLDERALSPHTILWARSFQVRSGVYGSVAYIENLNKEAGVRKVGYRFSLYDERNVLVAERNGETFIMPGGITPVFEGAIDTGNRKVIRTYLEFTEPLVWERMRAGEKDALVISNARALDVTTAPRIIATVRNVSVEDVTDPSFVAVVFDTAGNAIAASLTFLTRVTANESGEIVFTWPDPFQYVVGRVDVRPLVSPASLR